MIFSARRAELLTIARQASKAVPNAAFIKEIAGIHLTADEHSGKVTMTATNFEISIQASVGATVETGGAVVMNAPLLIAILSKLPDADVEMESAKDDHLLHVRCGNARYELNVLPGERFPMPEQPLPEGMVSASGIPELAKRTAFAASSERADRPSMHCVNLVISANGLTATACNGIQLMQTEGDKSCTGDSSWLIPATSMRTLAAIAGDDTVFSVGATKKTAVFWDGSLLFSARLIDGDYLNTELVFSGFKKTYTALLSAEDMRRGVDTAAALADGDSTIEIRLEDSGLVLKSERVVMTAESEHEMLGMSSYQNTTVVSAVVSVASDRPFYHSAKQLKDALCRMTGQIVIEFSARGDIVMRDEKSRYFQVARNKKKAAKKEKKAA